MDEPISSRTNQPIDLDLIDQIVALIDEKHYENLAKKFSEVFVDEMPSTVLYKLTDTYDDFEKAEAILNSYYMESNSLKELIIDSFNILGDQRTVAVLDSLNLQESTTQPE